MVLRATRDDENGRVPPARLLHLLQGQRLSGGAFVGDNGGGLLAADPSARLEPIEGGWRDFFHNEPIRDIHVPVSRGPLLKTRELTKGARDIMSRVGFPCGKFALAKASRSHIVPGGRVEGGGGESAAGL